MSTIIVGLKSIDTLRIGYNLNLMTVSNLSSKRNIAMPHTPPDPRNVMTTDQASFPVYRQVADKIQSRIVQGELAPGDILPSETALASTFNVHRSSIREAIRSLEEQGYVRRDPGKRKLHVAIPSAQVISRKLVEPLVLDQTSFEELWEAIRALDPAAAAAAANRHSAEDIEALEENLEASRMAINDPERLTRLDIEFHELVAHAARNRVIQAIRLPISDLFYPSFQTVISNLNAGDRLITAHEKILQAIKWDDPDEAKAWMIKHINDFKKAYELARLNMADPAPLPRDYLDERF